MRLGSKSIAGATLNYDFSQFTASVQGYTVTSYTGKATPPFDTFYIHIAEGKTLDTDALPTWWIVNTSLQALPGNKLVFSTHPNPPPFDATHGEHPADQANPVLGYTLGVAGQEPGVRALLGECSQFPWGRAPSD